MEGGDAEKRGGDFCGFGDFSLRQGLKSIEKSLNNSL